MTQNIMNCFNKIIKDIERIGSNGYKDGSSTKKGYFYHPIPFDDFSNIPVHKKSVLDEFKIILNDYGCFKDKKILDIGCANGFISFNLALMGANVVSYEGDEFVFNVNKEIQKYKSINNIEFINLYFDDNISFFLDKFDVIFLMNVHMWIYKQIGRERTKNMMKSLSKKTEILYFQTAHKESNGLFKINELENKKDLEEYLYDCGFVEIINLKSWDIGDNKGREFFKCISRK